MSRTTALATLFLLAALPGCDLFGPSDPSNDPDRELLIVPGDPRLLRAERLRLIAEYENGGRPVGSVTWSSSDPGVVEVNDHGIATGVSLGAATLTAEAEGETARTTVTVILAPVSCDEEGTAHGDTTIERATWRAADGPHRLTGRIAVEGELTIGAGAWVCGEGSGGILLLEGGRIDAVGTAEAPIVLTALDPGSPWGGIDADQEWLEPWDHFARLVHVRLEHARLGVAAYDVEVVSSEIRHVDGSAVQIHGDGRVVDTEIEFVGEGVDVWGGHDGRGGDGIVENVVVRKSGGSGVAVRAAGTVRLRNVRIEGAGGVGLYVDRDSKGFQARILEATGLRITDGAFIPASLNSGAVVSLLESIPVDSLTGNAADTLYIQGGYGFEGDATITPELSWVVTDLWADGLTFEGTITMEPGSYLRMGSEQGIGFRDGGKMLAEGTADRPVTIVGHPWGERIRFSSESRFCHVIFVGIPDPPPETCEPG